MRHKNTLCFPVIFVALMIALSLCGCQMPFFSKTQEKFDSFLDSCLKSYASESIIKLHSLFLRPDSYGIDESSCPSFPDLSSKKTEASLKENQKLLKELQSFHSSWLTSKQQNISAILEDKLKLSIEMQEKYPYYKTTLGSSGDAVSLISSLSQYTLENENDIKQYLELLKDIPDYFDSLIDYEKERQEKAITPSSTLVQDTYDAISTFLNSVGEENVLITGFDERIQKISSLNKKQLESYSQQNMDLIQETVLPAYIALEQSIANELTPSDENERICQYKNGKDYYKFLLKYNVGTDLSAEDCKEILEGMYEDASTDLSALTEEDSELYTEYYSAVPEYTDYADLMKQLRQNTLVYFPKIASISYDTEKISDSISSLENAAYYKIPALDEQEKQTIYLNDLKLDSDNIYSTLAHEGYPGHLYQTNYFYENLTYPLQLCLRNQGYDEGWATYAELFSDDYLSYSNKDDEITSELRRFTKDSSITSLCLCGLSDIYVNYENHNLDDLKQWLDGYGVDDLNADTIYRYVIANPTGYLSYIIGYYEFNNLYTKTKDNLSIQDFHKEVLQYGSCPFYLLSSFMGLEEDQ